MGHDMLFALGLLFSMASQLRLAGSSVLGLGELCLALWVLVSIGSQLSRVGPALTPALSRMLIFWGLFAVAESLGTLMGAAIHDEHDTQWFLHDILAYVLLASMSCLSVARPDAAMRLRRTGWLLVTLGTASLAIQLGAALELFEIPGVDPWDPGPPAWLRGYAKSTFHRLHCAFPSVLSSRRDGRLARQESCGLRVCHSAGICRLADPQRHVQPGACGRWPRLHCTQVAEMAVRA